MLLHLHVDGRQKCACVGWPVQACLTHRIGHFASFVTAEAAFPQVPQEAPECHLNDLQFKVDCPV